MAQWLIIAALATIGVTLVLIGVFYRVNRRVLERHQAEQRRREAGGDAGVAYVPSSGSNRHNDDAGRGDADGSDGGGGDGGGGGD
jgi:hypothetical protein